MLKNSDITGGTKDELFSKIVDLSSSSAMNLSFKYAYAPRSSGSTAKLQLHITNNCNSSWLQRILLADSALATAAATSADFVPSSGEWRQASTFIPAPFLSAGFRFRFTFTGDEANNIYLDDINLDVNAGITGLNEILADIDLYPNPANENTYLDFYSESEMNLQVAIYDLLGHHVKEIQTLKILKGRNKFMLPLTGLRAGSYIIRLNGDKGSMSKQILVLPE
jgi:hypothetical protein